MKEENSILFLFALLPVLFAFLLHLFFARTGRHDGRTPLGRVALGNGLVLMFLVSLVILGGEVYYRFIYDSSDSFGLTKNYQRWFDRHFHYNNAGVRDNVDYQRLATPGTQRIAFLGDSFTAGHGVKNVDERFANILRKARPDWEVHVVADLGWDTGFQLNRLHALGRQQYKADIVVLVYCLNDISDITPEWQKISDSIFSSPSPGMLVQSSYLFNTIYYRTFAQRNPDVGDYYSFVGAAYRGPVWKEQESRLTRLRNIVHRQGGALLVVTFPFLHALGPDYAYRDVHQKLDAFWHDLGIAHLDLLSIYENHEPRELVVNAYDAHPNEFAHAMAANAINHFISTRITEQGNGEP